MKKTFERFTGSHAPAKTTPTVTIQKRGVIALNRAAYDLLKRPQAVHLYFSREEQSIGFAPSDPKEPDAILIRKAKRTAVYWVAGMAFTKWYDIDSSLARRYEATAESGELYVDLKQQPKIVTSPIGKKQQAGEESFDALHEVQETMAHLETAVQGPGARELLSEIRQLLERYQHASGA
jgi:hypothetical protein